MADKKDQTIIGDGENVREEKEIVTGNGGDESDFLETGIYIYKFKAPYTWEGKTYTEIKFNFGILSGVDMKEAERDLSEEGRIIFSPLYSDSYLLNLAARAADVHPSVIENMPIRAAIAIRERARRFFMQED